MAWLSGNWLSLSFLLAASLTAAATSTIDSTDPAGLETHFAHLLRISFSARLDSMLDTYMTAYKDGTCMEEYSCQ